MRVFVCLFCIFSSLSSHLRPTHQILLLSFFFVFVFSDVAEHEHLNSSHRTLHVSVYDRSIGDTISAGPELGQTHLGLPTATATAGVEGVELFLGETEIELNFDQLVKMQKGWFDQWYKYVCLSVRLLPFSFIYSTSY